MTNIKAQMSNESQPDENQIIQSSERSAFYVIRINVSIDIWTFTFDIKKYNYTKIKSMKPK